MSELLAGKVQAGFRDASHWLKLFNAACNETLGMPVFPDSLNTTAARDRRDSWVVEIIADVNLTDHFGLRDGDVVEIRVRT
jgi:CTP-dependent riboflavin kinase